MIYIYLFWWTMTTITEPQSHILEKIYMENGEYTSKNTKKKNIDKNYLIDKSKWKWWCCKCMTTVCQQHQIHNKDVHKNRNTNCLVELCPNAKCTLRQFYYMIFISCWNEIFSNFLPLTLSFCSFSISHFDRVFFFISSRRF